jgi:hypothetical protein
MKKSMSRKNLNQFLAKRRARKLNMRPSTAGCVAQLVEQRIENPRVAGSIPAAATTSK